MMFAIVKSNPLRCPNAASGVKAMAKSKKREAEEASHDLDVVTERRNGQSGNYSPIHHGHRKLSASGASVRESYVVTCVTNQLNVGPASPYSVTQRQ